MQLIDLFLKTNDRSGEVKAACHTNSFTKNLRLQKETRIITMNNSTHINSYRAASCPYPVSVFFTTTMAVISLAAFTGNILVIVAVYKTPNLRTSTNYYYVNMAVSDLLACLTVWPLYLTDEIITIRGSLIHGPMATPGCKVGMYVRVLTTSVSILSLVLIAIDRFIATVFPLKATLLSRKLRIALLFATWLISMGYCFPMLYFSKVEEVGHETFCRFAWNNSFAIIIYYATGISMINIAPLIAIVILYSRIMLVLRKRPNPECNTGSKNFGQKRRKQSQNIMRIFKSVVTAYSACFFLFCVYLVLKMTFPEVFIRDKCKWILGFSYFVFPSLSAAINPIILFSFSSNFRFPLQTLFLDKMPVFMLQRKNNRINFIDQRCEPINTSEIPTEPDALEKLKTKKLILPYQRVTRNQELMKTASSR